MAKCLFLLVFLVHGEAVAVSPLRGGETCNLKPPNHHAVNLGESVTLEILDIGDHAPEATDAPSDRPSTIPAEVWAALQDAGQAAAERLRDLLKAKAFERLKPGDQARLIELALNRAYGPPIKREMTLSLSGNVSDAVAASLARLSASDLPEFGQKRRNVPSEGSDTGQG